MLFVLSKLNKRFALLQVVSLTFAISTIVMSSVESHAHIDHANHGHTIHDVNAHNADAAVDPIKKFFPEPQEKEHQNSDLHGSFAETVHCFSFIVPADIHVVFPAPNVLKHDRLTQRLLTRYPSRLERPPKNSA
ncbi:MAG: hypothetical protein ACRBCJ_13215 [Hyphomicrobiaceae bacterium]